MKSRKLKSFQMQSCITQLLFEEWSIRLSVSLQEVSHLHRVDCSYNWNHSFSSALKIIVLKASFFSMFGRQPRQKHLSTQTVMWSQTYSKSGARQSLQAINNIRLPVREEVTAPKPSVCVHYGKETCSQQQCQGQWKAKPEKGTVNTGEGGRLCVCFHWIESEFTENVAQEELPTCPEQN